MRWGELLIGATCIILSILAPDQLVNLALNVLGLNWLNMPWLGYMNPASILANLIAGSGFTFGLKQLWRGLRSRAES